MFTIGKFDNYTAGKYILYLSQRGQIDFLGVKSDFYMKIQIINPIRFEISFIYIFRLYTTKVNRALVRKSEEIDLIALITPMFEKNQLFNVRNTHIERAEATSYEFFDRKNVNAKSMDLAEMNKIRDSKVHKVFNIF